MIKYIEELKRLAYKAYKMGEVPVACVIEKNNKIISKAHNQKESQKNPMKHAEIIAITKACRMLKSWRLDDCVMYVTLKPCEMCQQIIKQSRISKVVYMNENIKTNGFKVKYYKYNGDCVKEFSEMMSNFFKEKR